MDRDSGGIGLLGTVQIVLIILKMTGLISWSWLLVLIPIWIWGGIILLALIFVYSEYDEVSKYSDKKIDEIWNGKHGEDD